MHVCIAVRLVTSLCGLLYGMPHAHELDDLLVGGWWLCRRRVPTCSCASGALRDTIVTLLGRVPVGLRDHVCVRHHRVFPTPSVGGWKTVLWCVDVARLCRSRDACSCAAIILEQRFPLSGSARCPTTCGGAHPAQLSRVSPRACGWAAGHVLVDVSSCWHAPAMWSGQYGSARVSGWSVVLTVTKCGVNSKDPAFGRVFVRH